MTPPNKSELPTISLDDLDEEQLEALVENVYEKAEELREGVAGPIVEAPEEPDPDIRKLGYSIDKTKGGRLFPSLDADRKATHLEDPILQERVTTVGEPRQVRADFDRMNATAFIELQRRAATAAQEVSDALGASCSAEAPKVWAEFEGQNPTPMGYMPAHDECFQGVGEAGEE